MHDHEINVFCCGVSFMALIVAIGLNSPVAILGNLLAVAVNGFVWYSARRDARLWED